MKHDIPHNSRNSTPRVHAPHDRPTTQESHSLATETPSTSNKPSNDENSLSLRAPRPCIRSGYDTKRRQVVKAGMRALSGDARHINIEACQSPCRCYCARKYRQTGADQARRAPPINVDERKLMREDRRSANRSRLSSHTAYRCRQLTGPPSD